jgi:hypothetical protein
MPALHVLRDSRRRLALAVAVAIALVLAQWLGMVHQVVHHGASRAGGHFGERVSVHAGEHPRAHDVGRTRDHRFGGVFDGHDDGGTHCHLYDQLAHADALSAMPCDVPDVTPPHAAPAVHASWQLAAEAAGALARGPPCLHS